MMRVYRLLWYLCFFYSALLYCASAYGGDDRSYVFHRYRNEGGTTQLSVCISIKSFELLTPRFITHQTCTAVNVDVRGTKCTDSNDEEGGEQRRREERVGKEERE